MTAAYTFVSRWRAPATRERCWEVLSATLSPRDAGCEPAPWWPDVTIVEAPTRIEPGSVIRLDVRSPFGYRLRVRLELTRVDAPTSLAAVSEGDLRGEGTLDIVPAEEGSVLTWTWRVSVRRPWMRATGWLLRPLFVVAHTFVMRRGERGFARVLAA
jgi:hypothetical protein